MCTPLIFKAYVYYMCRPLIFKAYVYYMCTPQEILKEYVYAFILARKY
jgi:hypothetical protein